eukprot:TRINITY_DN98542_c0_g1_i1.p1 TRINITY_DN98542_c0_g1~~TRINITY_DN98542_c0_g1_i1.p1  ORF type:complete len:197 (-),score=14.67 TRINITY_DN98542_c0_g1_i1:166-756(-)
MSNCGLCGKKGKLTRTHCCNQPICDDSANYVMFSYAHNSCHRNHERYTLCGFHHSEGHDSKTPWHECKECQDGFDGDTYNYYVTNDYNFYKHPNPPSFEPTMCCECGGGVRMDEAHCRTPEGMLCQACTMSSFNWMTSQGKEGAKKSSKDTNNSSHSCKVCNKLAESRCSCCKNVWYCSASCQKADWKSHKLVCTA